MRPCGEGGGLARWQLSHRSIAKAIGLPAAAFGAGLPVWQSRQRRCGAAVLEAAVFAAVVTAVVVAAFVAAFVAAAGIVWQRRHSIWRWLPCESGAIQSGASGAGAAATA